MPIDASIYGRVPLANFGDQAAEGFQTGMSMRSQMDTARRNNDAEAMQRSSADALRNSMVTNPDGTRTLDTKRAASNLFGVDPMKGLAFQKEAQNEEIEKQKATREKQKFEVDLTAQLAGSVKDQASWENALVTAQKYGIDTAQLPKQYDPSFVKMIHGRALSAKEQLDATYKEKELGFKERELGLKGQELNISRTKAQNENMKSAGTLGSDLRKERSGLGVTKDTQQMAVAYNKIQAAVKNPSPAGDMSLVFGYMKMLDPGSTVREGEYANARNAAGVPTKILNAYNKALSGEFLDDVQRKDFVGQAGGLYKAQMDVQNQVDSQYAQMAQEAGIDPKKVLLNFGANSAEPGTKPPLANQEADVSKYAKTHGISYEAAAQVKAQRSSKQAGL